MLFFLLVVFFFVVVVCLLLFFYHQYLVDFNIVIYVKLPFEQTQLTRILISRNLGKCPLEDILRNVY